jgi:hypothetical protein
MIKFRSFGISIGLFALMVALAIPTFAAKPGSDDGTNINPYPATSRANCDKVGGVFHDFGNGQKECVVQDDSSAIYYHAESQKDKGKGGWTITRVIDVTYGLDQGTRTYVEVPGSTLECLNPGGKDMTNTWIHPCLPESYDFSDPIL